MNDREFLLWIWHRLSDIHAENPHVDYMKRLWSIMDAAPCREESHMTKFYVWEADEDNTNGVLDGYQTLDEFLEWVKVYKAITPAQALRLAAQEAWDEWDGDEWMLDKPLFYYVASFPNPFEAKLFKLSVTCNPSFAIMEADTNG